MSSYPTIIDTYDYQMKKDICNILVQRLKEGREEIEAEKNQKIEAEMQLRREYNVHSYHITPETMELH